MTEKEVFDLSTQKFESPTEEVDEIFDLDEQKFVP